MPSQPNCGAVGISLGRSGRDGYRMVSQGNRDLWLLGILGFSLGFVDPVDVGSVES